MKKFSFFWMAALALVVGGALVACSQDESLGTDPEPDFYTVQLGWGGEIVDIAYEPLDTRATTDDLYGIQVYSTPDIELEEGEEVWIRFAYGLFDDPNNISITLPKGYKYKFKATMIVDGKNRIYKSRDIYNDVGRYLSPFWIYITNSFDYQINEGFNPNEGSASIYFGEDSRQYAHPNVERFYGELLYNPKQSNTSAIIPMKRTNFGAKFVAAGTLATSGTLEIEMEQAPILELELTAGEDSISDIFTFEYVYQAWLNDDYTETIGVSFKWIREDGSMVPLGTHNIKFKRNTTTVVTVNINKDGETEGVGFSIDESEQGEMPVEEDNSVTITDGEVEE